MSKCVRCDVAFTSKETFLTCAECKRAFHPACTRIGAELLTKTRSKSWKCDDCQDETSSTASNKSIEGQDDKKSILEAIRRVKKDINKNIDDKIFSVLNSVSAVSDDIKELKETVTSLQQSHSNLEERCDNLEHENEALRKAVASLRLQVLDSEQHQRAANIEIVGLPFTEREDVYACLEKIAAALNIHYKREEVSIAHRLRLYSRKRHNHPPIICQFVSRSVKSSWLSAARSKKHLAASEIHPSFAQSPVYINEHLTKENKMLLGRARRLMRDQKIHFAGYFNGKVMIKITATADSIQLTDIKQLDSFDET